MTWILLTTLAICCLQARASVYTTFNQISIYYGDNLNEVVVTWASNVNSSTLQVHYGRQPHQLFDRAQPLTPQQYTYNDSMGYYVSPFFYQTTLTNLKIGNVMYYYRIGSIDTGYSETFAFKSNPGLTIGPTTFYVMGDVGQTENSANTLRDLYNREKELKGYSGGVILNGDISYADGNNSRWDSFGELKQFVNAEIPFAYIVGNHEWADTVDAQGNYDFLPYKMRYYNPEVNGKKQFWYSFERGFVHWIMLAGYCESYKSKMIVPLPCLAPDSEQMNWLIQDLKSVDRSITPWVIVSFHQPYVNSNVAFPYQTDAASIEIALEDVLYEYKVDLVFSGHVHAYERSAQVYHYQVSAGAPWYITIGDGGNREGLCTEWVDPQPHWSLFRQASYGFGELTVVNSTHANWKWLQNEDLTPLVADEYWYIRGSDLKEVLDRVEIKHETKEPVFANTPRGRRGAEFNTLMLQQKAYIRQTSLSQGKT